ncbi:hypothetical protein ACFL3F_01235 [Planctomycetota bacterium]
MRSTLQKQLPLTIAALLFGFIVSGCHNVGPSTIPRDRFDYTEAISDSWKKQMLLNLVKLRYNDAPVFLEVSSIISQYAFETSVNAGLGWSDSALAGNSQSLGGSGRYTDRPTITYSPLMGEKFTRELMTPIPPAAIFSMIQAGWPVDRVLQVCVQSVNGLNNRAGSMAFARQAHPDFYRLILALRRVQQSGGVGIRVQKKDDEITTVLVFQKNIDESLRKDVHLVRELLGLEMEGHEFQLVYGHTSRAPNELAVLSRSMMEVLMEISTYVEVPPEHLTRGRVLPVLEESDQLPSGLIPMMRILTSEKEPDEAFVSVKYGGQYFWIDDYDPRSRGMLTFLMILFSLTETGGGAGVPLVTIPAG